VESAWCVVSSTRRYCCSKIIFCSFDFRGLQGF